MKAMIFAAGLGTRLKPLTDTMPKAMAPVNGRPLIEHVILKLKASGFDEIIVNVHHFANQIIDFLKEQNNYGIRIEISDERKQLLETGGGIKKAAHFFDDGKPFLIHNVDILSNLNLKKAYQQAEKNQQEGALSTLLMSERNSSRHLFFDEEMRLSGWKNEKTGETKSPIKNFKPDEFTPLAFSGIHIMSPKMFPLMQAWPDKFSIIDFYLAAAKDNTLKGYDCKNLKLLDVGKIDTLNQASDFLKEV